ncbi:hypothetical protein DSO57_1027367 [Entomophthora muscae]|uniref:Uncharacterized protein n=1 Tax=Entomophthora muscae TaxID=34485 RepID=A0ACC2UND6_9FUNG|nr:hypothetical protein DSO57_1027367 [Entomophthora muscae]
MISFRKEKKIADFADHFYLKAKIFTGSGSLTVHDAHIALHVAVKSYEVLYCTLMPAFQDNCTLDAWHTHLVPPNVRTKPCYPNFPGRLEVPPSTNKFVPKNDITKVVCHHCNWKGHYASKCNSNTGIHTLPPLESKLQGKVNVE